MGDFLFDIADVRVQYEHLLESTLFSPLTDDQKGPALWLCIDDGIYLMSNGMPRLLSEKGAFNIKVAYAHGFDPAANPDWKEKAREVLGAVNNGVFYIPLKAIIDILKQTSIEWVCCTFDGKTFGVGYITK